VTLASQIRLLTIDLDDTLWPCAPTIIHAEQVSYDWLAQHLPDITRRYSMDGLREKRKALMQSRPELRNDLSEARRAHFRELADECGYNHDWIEDGFRVFHAARQHVTYFEDVLPVLTQLSQRYTLVALTNGNADVVRTGLGPYFAFQVSAADVQAAKPHPAMFHHAMQRAGVRADQTLHVGDHAIHDVQGAKAAGVRSVWVNRLQTHWTETEFNADFEVSTLYGLLDLLK
jgi:putative hydrolase of the HAD superfamily